MSRFKNRPREHDMAERPETAVGQAVVVAFLLLLGQPDSAERITRVLGGYAHSVVGVDRQTIGVAGAMGDPCAAARQHHRIERSRHPARRAHALDNVADIAVNVRLSIGDDDEPLAMQLGIDQIM